MSWDHCPESLRAYRAASWKINDQIAGSLLPYAKSITGTGALTNQNTVQTQKPQAGRTIIGPGALFNFQALECFYSTDVDLLPKNQDWSFYFVVFHNNDFSQLSANNNAHGQPNFSYCCTIVQGGVERLGPTILQTETTRLRFYSTCKGSSPSTYFDIAGLTGYTEPFLCCVSINYAGGTVTFRYYGLITGTLWATHNVSTTFGTADADTLIIGRYRLGSVGTAYQQSRPVIDCWSTLQNYAMSEADGHAVRARIFEQREYVQEWIKIRGLKYGV